MWIQKELNISPKKRGFHLITDEIVRQVPELSKVSVRLSHIFIKHTSAYLTINENADPTVRDDFESLFSRAVPEDEPYYKHICEGSDGFTATLRPVYLGVVFLFLCPMGDLTWELCKVFIYVSIIIMVVLALWLSRFMGTVK